MYNKEILNLKEEEISSIKNSLKKEFGDSTYNVWLKDINFISITDFEIVISLPNNFTRDYVAREYLNGTSKNVNGKIVWLRKGIKEILQNYYPKLLSANLIVEHKFKNEFNDKVDNKTNNVVSTSENNNLYNVGIDLNKNYTFDNFVVGKSNKIAFETSKNIADNGIIDNNLNPLFLYGSVGIGKTHLCQSIAWKMKENFANKNIVYISAEKFMFLFVQACKNQEINDFKNKFRNIDCLIIDDIQFIIGKEATQKEFFYTFETLINDNKQVILACDRSPVNLIGLDDKLKSRLNGGMIIDIKDNDYILTSNIIKKKCENFKFFLSDELIQYLAENIKTDTRQLEGCLKRLQMNENIMKVKTTIEVIDDILFDNIKENHKNEITIDNILKETASYFSISIEELKSEQRLKEFIIPRHISMYLCKKLTNKSFPDIAKKMNKKNHATIIYAYKKIEELIEKDTEILNFVKDLKKKI